MFRVLRGGLCLESEFPETLQGLGYAINKKNFLRPVDSITKQIEPEGFFKYKISNNDRFNDRHKLNFNRAVRKEVVQQIAESGLLEPLYLLGKPGLTTTKPRKDTPFVPIYCSPKKKLLAAKRVVVIVQGSDDQWLWWAWNDIEGAKSLTDSSVLGIAEELEKYPDVALVMLNPCQLRYSYKSQQPCSFEDWEGQIRETTSHSSATVLDKNLIAGHETPKKHLEYMFNHFINNPEYINPKAKIDIIGVNSGTDLVCQFLNKNWNDYTPAYARLSAVAMANFYTPYPLDKPECAKYLGRKGRAWNKTEFAKDEIQAVPWDDPKNKDVGEVLSTIISLGPELKESQSAFAEAYKDMLKWLNKVAQNPNYDDWEKSELQPKMTRKGEAAKEAAEQKVRDEENDAAAAAEWKVCDDKKT
ncbi:hypothetical protein BT63DRAFT_409416 [Microthyrium microscopicum]|uniref:Arb2 domain-containing protein n=1 Tax=Microthyrium microscopicum TaxID=703497 RepID=A0A6A6USK4_9PEZI|nr:hypothetical protein BT63DRAFT_409416 [Microthyrium microscopicum]